MVGVIPAYRDLVTISASIVGDHLFPDKDGLGRLPYRYLPHGVLRRYGCPVGRYRSPSVPLPQRQPEGLRDPETHLYDCGNWAVSASWRSPEDATSGIYFARLVRQDSALRGWRADNSLAEPAEKPQPTTHAYGALGHGRLANALIEPRASHIYFVVRDDHSTSDVLFQTADTTWQAYNRYGGHCTYGRLDPDNPRIHGGPPRAYKVSYNRPLETRHYRAVNTVFTCEYPFVRWLEANGYDVSYFTGVDSARRGERILNHRLFLSVGHDEYWSLEQRQHVETARGEESTWHFSAAMKCSGRSAGRMPSTAAVPRTGRW
ncbi:MAG: hypothetical protein CM1200mP20_09980 [Pseudomonadota bacterium]|nr:MAG: hypothetical protein CM1200mP20_09980 [Pseudomonadota bacterium]